MESKQTQAAAFDPKQYYKQCTMNFVGQEDGFNNDDLMDDDDDMAQTPSSATEDCT